MKTEQEVDAARLKLANKLAAATLTGEQTLLLIGMLNALVWAAGGENGSTVQRILDGELLSGGPDDPSGSLDRFRRQIDARRPGK